MTHEMKLQPKYYDYILTGTKRIEIRLNDEKRQLINVGDKITFENRSDGEKIQVKVLGLHKYPSFEELYNHFDKVSMGYKEDEKADPKDMEQYYSSEEQSKYGVVGIEMELIK